MEGTPAELLIEPNSVATGVWTQYSITNAIAPAGATQVQVSFDFTSTVQHATGRWVVSSMMPISKAPASCRTSPSGRLTEAAIGT